MNAAIRPFYGAAAQLGRLAAALVPAGQSKLARTLAARRGIRARYRAWGAQHREANRPLLWMHAPSVGEGLQARPVLERLRTRRPDIQLAYTYFSPSAQRFADGLPVDFRDYLPFDTAADARAALEALSPRALVFSKLDVWPVLVHEAARRGVKLGLTSATLSPDSSRGGWWSALLLREAYAQLDAVGAIDADDAERLVHLGVRRDVIQVTGDTRFDQVWERAERARRESHWKSILGCDRPTLVAGSTWPADEAHLLPAFAECRKANPGVRLIIAPHEPTEMHLVPIEDWARDGRISIARLGAPVAATADVVLVDRVGVLGDLYALGQAAFVGGGFHAAGLHSVLEPAAFGAPVAFGPRHAGVRDARLLLAAGGAIAASGTEDLAATFTRWFGTPETATAAGQAARRVIERGLGAADRSTDLVAQLFGN